MIANLVANAGLVERFAEYGADQAISADRSECGMPAARPWGGSTSANTARQAKVPNAAEAAVYEAVLCVSQIGWRSFLIQCGDQRRELPRTLLHFAERALL
jgi:hypothetical protein